MVTPDSRGSSCNRTGTRLQSHRSSSWRCQGQDRRAWPSGTGPVADSKKTCNTHYSLEQEGQKETITWHPGEFRGQRVPQVLPRTSKGLPQSVKFNPQDFPKLRPFYHKNVPLLTTPVLTVQGYPWSSWSQNGICCVECPKGSYSQNFQLPQYYS